MDDDAVGSGSGDPIAEGGPGRPGAARQALTGPSGPEMQENGRLSVIHSEDRGRTESAWRAAVARGGLYAVEHRVVRADGTAGVVSAAEA